MRKVNLNEKEALENILTNNVIESPAEAIELMMKYYIQKGLDRDDLEEEIFNFINSHEDIYSNYDWWSEFASKKINKAFSLIDNGTYNANLFTLDKVEVYKEEIETINCLETDELRNLAFIMLVYAKINTMKREFKIGRQIDEKGNLKEREYWISNLDTDCITAIFTEAGSKRLALEPRMRELVEIIKHDMIEPRCGKNNNLKLLYVKDEGEVAFTIKDFSDDTVIFNYLLYCYPNAYTKCEKCGKYFKKQKKNQMYCFSCGHTKQLTDRQLEAKQKEKTKQKAKPALLKGKGKRK